MVSKGFGSAEAFFSVFAQSIVHRSPAVVTWDFTIVHQSQLTSSFLDPTYRRVRDEIK
jgi:hypothetical protein